MNKEFAPYPEALELKKIGFDEPCFEFYTEEYKTLVKNFCKYPINLPTKPFLAPTYSQAFRFFREKHNLFSSEVYDRGLNNGKIPIIHSYSFRILNLNNFEDFYGNVFKTYEEAELACLRKLISIIKNK